MRDRTKRIFSNLCLGQDKGDVYNFTDSEHDPYSSDDQSEFIPSSSVSGSSKSTKSVDYFGGNTIDLSGPNPQEVECSDLSTISNYLPFDFEYDNDFNGHCIFDQDVLASLKIYFPLPTQQKKGSSSLGQNYRMIPNEQEAHGIYESPFIIKNKYKKTKCIFCETLVVSKHFSRHLERHHSNERQVRELQSYEVGSREKKHLLELLRNEGNMDDALRGKIIPKKRKIGEEINEKNFAICSHCKGFFRRLCLSRHVKKCFAKNPGQTTEDESRPLTNSLIFAACSKKFGEFLSASSVKKEIFAKMQPDEITNEALQDLLVVNYGEDLLKKTKLKRKVYHISNKLRECGKFLLEMKKIQNHDGMLSILRPENFDDCLAAVRSISKFNPTSRSFGAASLALHFRTTLTALSDLASKLILRKKIPLCDDKIEECLKNLERFKNLINSQWATEIGSLALKDLNEKGSVKPKALPLTEDIIKLVHLVNKKADEAYETLKVSKDTEAFKILVETTLVATILHNRKRVGDVQYLDWKSCEDQLNRHNIANETEFTASLTESEKILTKNYCKITTIGKGSRPVTILIPKSIQKYFLKICQLRKENWFPETNIYFFTYPKSKFWVDGCSVMRKYAAMCGAKHPELLTSNRLRKHIATVTQLLALKHNEIDQLSKFMGHTSKTHETFYKLPEDVYQVAKVSKILQIMEKGKAAEFKNKSLEEIDINIDEIDYESDQEELESNEINNRANENQGPPDSKYQSESPSESRQKIRQENGERLRWTSKQKTIMRDFFKEAICSKKAPRKTECAAFLEKHSNLFQAVTWLKVKTFVYNEYRLK